LILKNCIGTKWQKPVSGSEICFCQTSLNRIDVYFFTYKYIIVNCKMLVY